jgi:hypothetical protein
MTHKIYSLIGIDGFECVLPVDKEDYKALDFDGSPRISTWRPILMQLVNEDTGQKRPSKKADFPWQGTGQSLVLRKAALDAMRDILERSCEILPLQTEDDSELYITNTQVLQALDVDRSEIWRFPNSGKIMYVKRPHFMPHLLRDVDMFRDASVGSETFVSEKFVQRYHDNKLRGLKFHEMQTLG